MDLLERSGNIDPEHVTVTIPLTPAAGNSDPNDEVASAGDLCQIEIQVPFSEVAYIPGNYLGGKLLRAACTMRRE